MEEKQFTRGNVTVTFSEKGCWIEVFGDEGEEQSIALEPSEMYLVYMALGDYFEKANNLPPKS